MQINQSQTRLQSTQLLREKFLSKRSNSMNIKYQYSAFVPTMYPKIKDRDTSPLRLIKSVIDEDKEGGYSDGEDGKNNQCCRRVVNRLKNSIIDENKREFKSSIEIPKINFNDSKLVYTHIITREPVSMKMSSDSNSSIQNKITDNLEADNLPPLKKKNSILYSLEKRKTSSNC